MGLQVEEATFKGYDGAELFFQSWPKKSPQAVILGVHGLGEYADCYNFLAQGLEDTPYQLVMSDLRGHGRSSGKRGVGGIDEFVRDIKLFYSLVKARFSGLPIFILGHSMGGLIVCKFLIRHSDAAFSGVVLSSPLMGIAVEVPAFKKKSAGVLAKVLPNLTLYNEIPLSHLTLDKRIVQTYESDHLRHDRISAGLFSEMLQSIDYVFHQSDKIRGPLLLQQAGDDLVVSRGKGKELFDRLKIPDKEYIVYEGYYHEIYNEVHREKPYEDLKRWLKGHLS